jgi:hypothetical protein
MFVKHLEAFLEKFFDTSLGVLITVAVTSSVVANCCTLRTLFSCGNSDGIQEINILIHHSD